MLEPIIAPSTGVSLFMSEAFSKGLPPVPARVMRPDSHQLEPLEMMSKPWLLPNLVLIDHPQLEPPISFERTRLLIAHEGGMGKTYSALIAALATLRRKGGTLLIICPTQVKQTWSREVERFGSFLPQRLAFNTILRNADAGVFITSKGSVLNSDLTPHRIAAYKTAIQDQHNGSLTVVVDEAHYGGIAAGADDEEAGEMYARIQQICSVADSVFLTTATPMRKKPEELKQLLGMWLPEGAPLRAAVEERLPQLLTALDDQTLALRADWFPLIERIRTQSLEEGDDHLFRSMLLEMTLNTAEERTYLEHVLPMVDVAASVTQHGPSLARDLHPLGRLLSAAERSDLGEEEANHRFRTWATRRIEVRLAMEAPAPFPDAGRSPNGELRSPVREHWGNLLTDEYEGTTADHVLERRASPEFMDGLNGLRSTDPRFVALVNIANNERNMAEGEHWSLFRGVLVFVRHKGTARFLKEDLDDHEDILAVMHTLEEPDDVDLGGDPRPVSESDLRRFAERSWKNRRIPVVVTTDRLAEGVGVEWASAVVHWHVPSSAELIVQRNWRLDRRMWSEDWGEKFPSPFQAIVLDSGAVGVDDINLQHAKNRTVLGLRSFLSGGASPLIAPGDADVNHTFLPDARPPPFSSVEVVQLLRWLAGEVNVPSEAAAELFATTILRCAGLRPQDHRLPDGGYTFEGLGDHVDHSALVALLASAGKEDLRFLRHLLPSVRLHPTVGLSIGANPLAHVRSYAMVHPAGQLARNLHRASPAGLGCAVLYADVPHRVQYFMHEQAFEHRFAPQVLAIEDAAPSWCWVAVGDTPPRQLDSGDIYDEALGEMHSTVLNTLIDHVASGAEAEIIEVQQALVPGLYQLYCEWFDANEHVVHTVAQWRFRYANDAAWNGEGDTPSPLVQVLEVRPIA